MIKQKLVSGNRLFKLSPLHARFRGTSRITLISAVPVRCHSELYGCLTVGLGRLGLPKRGDWRLTGTYISSKPCRRILNRSSMQLALERASLSTAVSYPREGYSRPIPLFAIVLVALAVHGPLLLMQLPAGSFDTNFHIFFASHYAHHWFDPWNEKWFAGFSQRSEEHT